MNSTIEEQQQTISRLRQELQNALDECKRLRKSPPLILPTKQGSNVAPVESAPRDAFDDPRIAAEIARLKDELGQFHAAINREKQTKWHEEVKSLASELIQAGEYPIESPKYVSPWKLARAGTLLNDLWQCYTHKANHVCLGLEIKRLNAENTILRGIAAKIMPCHYCGVDEISKCPSGFPGCALADDLMMAEELHGEHLRTQLERRTKEKDDARTQTAGKQLLARLEALEKAAQQFVKKCETGLAQSKESYAAFKAALEVGKI